SSWGSSPSPPCCSAPPSPNAMRPAGARRPTTPVCRRARSACAWRSRRGTWGGGAGTSGPAGGRGPTGWGGSTAPPGAGFPGRPRGGFSGTFEGFRALVHPDDRAHVEHSILRAIEDRTGYDVEFRSVWADGSIHWMAGRGRVVRDETGRPVSMIGVGAEVTER